MKSVRSVLLLYHRRHLPAHIIASNSETAKMRLMTTAAKKSTKSRFKLRPIHIAAFCFQTIFSNYRICHVFGQRRFHSFGVWNFLCNAFGVVPGDVSADVMRLSAVEPTKKKADEGNEDSTLHHDAPEKVHKQRYRV